MQKAAAVGEAPGRLPTKLEPHRQPHQQWSAHMEGSVGEMGRRMRSVLVSVLGTNLRAREAGPSNETGRRGTPHRSQRHHHCVGMPQRRLTIRYRPISGRADTARPAACLSSARVTAWLRQLAASHWPESQLANPKLRPFSLVASICPELPTGAVLQQELAERAASPLRPARPRRSRNPWPTPGALPSTRSTFPSLAARACAGAQLAPCTLRPPDFSSTILPLLAG